MRKVKSRSILFQPYNVQPPTKEHPEFLLLLYSSFIKNSSPTEYTVGYTLAIRYVSKECNNSLINEVIFCSSNINIPTWYSITSDYAVKTVIGWLTLKPGDTDEEYFSSYTPEQLEFCKKHAENLVIEVETLFGDT